MNINVRVSDEWADWLDKLAARLSHGGALPVTRAEAVRYLIAQARAAEDKQGRKAKK